jgi:hypothetical protein
MLIYKVTLTQKYVTQVEADDPKQALEMAENEVKEKMLAFEPQTRNIKEVAASE